MPLAHPQQRCSLHAAQLLLPMQLNGIDDPGHSDLRQHAIPPAQTGQIVCSQTVAEFVPPVAGETAGAMISSGGGSGRPVFGGPDPDTKLGPRAAADLSVVTPRRSRLGN